MKTKTVLLVITVLVLHSISLFGEDTKAIEGRLNAKLQNGYLMFRVPRSGQKLRFDADGSSKNPIGIRGLDELVQVNSVKIVKNELVLKGPRLQNGYSVKDQTVELTRLPDAIEIHLALTDTTSEAEIAKSYNSVFLRTEEIPRRTCKDYKYLAETMTNFHPVTKEEKEKKEATRPTVPDRESTEVCMPSGALGWLMGKGMNPPKPIKDPDPDYGDMERLAHVQGTFLVAIRIDETGKITDGIALSTASAGFQQKTTDILSKWLFKPAEKNGNPVASVIEVEVNFHMR